MDRSGWSWWQYPLLPFALVYTGFGLALPWLYSRGPLKLFAVFFGLWLFWGLMAVNFDSDAAGSTSSTTREEMASGFRGPRCDPRYIGFVGGWPFGRTYLFGIECSAAMTSTMLQSVRLDDQADWVEQQWSLTYHEFRILGEFSIAYVYLGLMTFFSVFIFPIWAVFWGIYQLVSKVRIGWE